MAVNQQYDNPATRQHATRLGQALAYDLEQFLTGTNLERLEALQDIENIFYELLSRDLNRRQTE